MSEVRVRFGDGVGKREIGVTENRVKRERRLRFGDRVGETENRAKIEQEKDRDGRNITEKSKTKLTFTEANNN